MDVNEVYQLLCVVEKAMGHPRLKSIVDLAAKQLDELAAAAQIELNEIAAAEKQEAEAKAPEPEAEVKVSVPVTKPDTNGVIEEQKAKYNNPERRV